MSLPAPRPAGSRVVADASVILAWYLPADPYKDEALALLEDAAANRAVICVPPLTRFEVLNVVALSVRGTTPRRRLSRDEANEILAAFLGLPLEEHPIAGLEREILEVAVTHQRSAYDAAYPVLAEALDAEFITGDARLFKALRRRFPRMRLLGRKQ